MKKSILSLIVLLSFFVLEARAVVQTQEIQYRVGAQTFTGYLALNDAISGKRPGILVVHEWWGHDAYARKRAEILAAMGYTAFALDLYGSGKHAEHPDDAKQFMTAALNDLGETDKRIKAAYEILQNQPTVDKNKIAAIGYCMGGGVVLHMGRTGLVDLDAVVSFHGNLQLAIREPKQSGPVKTKMLVFTGGADPFVPVEQVKAFEASMTADGIPYELKTYPGVKHSFTVPHASEVGKHFGLPLVYDPEADKDSWNMMQEFFDDIFGKPKTNF
ncbi:dienelactone hydrolase family protein [Nitrospira defluvii]|nr:dienelactone hydrolase family protein [Nitrospira defluvii]